MKLLDFNVGDTVLMWAPDKEMKVETQVGCIHPEEGALYLAEGSILYERGTPCTVPHHDTAWVCKELRGHIMSDSTKGKRLKLIRKAVIHPRLIK